jgi:hypothetical protein
MASLAQKEYAPNGVRVLFSFVLAPYQMATKQKFGSLREVEGLKLRAIGAAQEVTLKKLKIVPVRMPSPEVHESMSRGTIDGAIFPYSSMLSYDLPVKYVTEGENFGTAAGALSDQRGALEDLAGQCAESDAGSRGGHDSTRLYGIRQGRSDRDGKTSPERRDHRDTAR